MQRRVTLALTVEVEFINLTDKCSQDPEQLMSGPRLVGSITRQVLGRLGDNWTILVIHALELGPHRYRDLQRAIPGISQKMLTNTLRTLERDGYLRRKVQPVVPPNVEYRLTEIGVALSDLVSFAESWARDNFAEINRARNDYDTR
jgi:DNA-binding HxlR family transcriptional regulator